MLENSLDVVKIVRAGRSLNTLLHLLLTKKERLLVRIQRKHILLDQRFCADDTDAISD